MFLIIIVLGFQASISAQTTWFHLTLEESASDVTVSRIRCIALPSVNQLSQFHKHADNQISFNSRTPKGKSSVHFLDLTSSVKGPLVKMDSSIAHLKIRPLALDYSVVKKGKSDTLYIIKNNTLEAVHRAKAINNYEWVNHDVLVITETDEQYKTMTHLIDLSSNRKTYLCSNPGVSLCRKSDSEIAFIDKFSNTYRYIKNHNLNTQRSGIVIKIPNEIEKFSVRDDDYFILVLGKLLRFTPGKDAGWKQLYNFVDIGLDNAVEIYFIQNNEWVIGVENSKK